MNPCTACRYRRAARRLLAWPLVALSLPIAAAAPARAESVAAPGYAITVHGPYDLTKARLVELAATPKATLPGIAMDFQAREAMEAEEEREEGLGFGVEGGIVPPPPDLEPEGESSRFLEKADQTSLAVTSWKGITTTGDLAADTQIAASHTHVVVTTRTTIGFFNKAGQLLQQLSATDFFAPAKLNLVGTHGGVTNFFDNRLIFDPYRNRFWLAALAFDTNLADTNLNKLVVGVSKSLDPRDGWWIYWWDAVPGDGVPGAHGNVAGDSADYPLLGVDPLHFVQTNWVADNTPYPRPSGFHSTHQISFVSAADLAAGKATHGYRWYDLPDGQSILQPAVHHGPTARSYFVNTVGGDRIAVWSASNPLMSTRKLERTYVTVRPFAYPVDAPQKGGGDSRLMLTNLGNSPLKATFRAGKLYLAFNDAVNWYGDGVLTSARLVRLNVSGYPTVPPPEVDRTFGGRSSFYDEPGYRVHYGFPAVAVNKAGDAVVVYARSGSQVYPEVAFSVYPKNGPDVLPSRRLKQGEERVRWGTSKLIQLHDLNGVAVDPHDDTAVWMAAPYGLKSSSAPPHLGGNANFAIWVGKAFGARTADLTAPAVVFGPTPIFRGGKLTVTTSVHNQGDGNAGASRINVSLRRNGSSTTVKLGEVNMLPVASGQTLKLIATFTVPTTLAKGIYVVQADVDATNLVLEYSGVNNRGTALKLLDVR
jgi:hypothetical protein